MKRYNLLDGESYGKRYQMAEESNGDWVWYEEVEHLETINAELVEACEGLLGLAERHGWLHVAVNAARSAIAKAKGEGV